jgi:hypothetical protein
MMMGMTAVLLTLMAGAGKVHDGTPGRDGTGNHQLGDEEEEGEEMGEDEAANDEEMHGGNVATRSQTARGRERGMEMALASPATLHYADARKRPDAEKWKSAEKVEIKNCFDNGTFEVCEAKDVPHGTKVMNCVFSYKVKTDSEGNETQCKARLNCDDRYQSESTYSETSHRPADSLT